MPDSESQLSCFLSDVESKQQQQEKDMKIEGKLLGNRKGPLGGEMGISVGDRRNKYNKSTYIPV
jgi:hypothetical protein